MVVQGEHRSGFAVVDVETTGFSPDDERIVEVGLVALDADGVEVGSFSTLIDPGRPPGPTYVHGISAAMLKGAPTFDAIHAYLADQLSGRVVVGHNVDCFDLAFLRAECVRYGGPALAPRDVPSVDTLAVAQRHLGLEGKAKLVECCSHFGLTWDEPLRTQRSLVRKGNVTEIHQVIRQQLVVRLEPEMSAPERRTPLHAAEVANGSRVRERGITRPEPQNRIFGDHGE